MFRTGAIVADIGSFATRIGYTNWKGLMRVIKGLNSRYTLLDLITGKEIGRAHV